jgi:hypothetical protein
VDQLTKGLPHRGRADLQPGREIALGDFLALTQTAVLNSGTQPRVHLNERLSLDTGDIGARLMGGQLL